MLNLEEYEDERLRPETLTESSCSSVQHSSMLIRKGGSVMRQARSEKAMFGARLREAREKAGITREDAAEAAGAQVAAIKAWERGTSLPNPLQLRGLIACYGITSHQLLFGRPAVEFTSEEAIELARAAQSFSPQLRVKTSVVLAMAARSGEDRTLPAG